MFSKTANLEATLMRNRIVGLVASICRGVHGNAQQAARHPFKSLERYILQLCVCGVLSLPVFPASVMAIGTSSAESRVANIASAEEITECKSAADCDALYPPRPGATNLCEEGYCIQAPPPPLGPNSAIDCHERGERDFRNLLRAFPGFTQLAAYLSCVQEGECYRVNGGGLNFEQEQCIISRNGGSWSPEDLDKLCQSLALVVQFSRQQLEAVDQAIMGVENSISAVETSIWALEQMLASTHDAAESARLENELKECRTRLENLRRQVEELRKERQKKELDLQTLLKLYDLSCRRG